PLSFCNITGGNYDNLLLKMKRTLLVFVVMGVICCNKLYSNNYQTNLVNDRDTTAKPNFIFFITDDIGWQDLGCYGSPNVKTPNIDSLAVRGLKFENAYLTTSSCSPSRSSII